MSENRTITPTGGEETEKFYRISEKDLRSLLQDRKKLNQLNLDTNLAIIAADTLSGPTSPQSEFTPIPAIAKVESGFGVSDDPNAPGPVQPAQHTRPTESQIEIQNRPPERALTPKAEILQVAIDTRLPRERVEKIEGSVMDRVMAAQMIPVVTEKALRADMTLEDTKREYQTNVPYKAIMEAVLQVIETENRLLPYKDKTKIPALMDSEKTRIIMTGIEMGMSRRAACALVGINRGMFSKWLSLARQEWEPYVSFYSLMDLAEARTEAELVMVWRKAAQTSWQAAEAFMKRRFAGDWGDKQVVTLQPHQIAQMSLDELEQFLGAKSVNTIDAVIEEQNRLEDEDDDGVDFDENAHADEIDFENDDSDENSDDLTGAFEQHKLGAIRD